MIPQACQFGIDEMIGHLQITKARQQGYKPVAIFIEAGLTQPVANYDFDNPERMLDYKTLPVVHIKQEEMAHYHDFRFVAECRVHLHGQSMSDELLAIADRLIESKASHVVVCALDSTELLEYKNNEWSVWK